MTRVIAGQYRGRRLQVPNGESVRPTTDRVKEAVFNILGPLDDLSVLDLFAGSGGLGIEALSRGASNVHFVESSSATSRILRSNLETLSIENGWTLTNMPALRALNRLKKESVRFDLVFLDPPYKTNYLAEVLEPGLLSDVLAPRGRVVAESSSVAKLKVPEAWEIITERRYGTTSIRILSRGC